ncbi:MAG: sugar ABC transporter ATP-binding protein [Gemmataceae bacterium]
MPNEPHPPQTLLYASRIRKQFPGVLALDDVSISIDRGEVLAVVGENGAGKSTLMKVIAGIYQPDAGSIEFDGKTVEFDGPTAATNAGVSLIHQELNLAENLTVLDNLFLGRELTTGGAIRLLRRQAMVERALPLLDRVGLPRYLLNRVVGDLAPGQKQLVEIARSLGLDAKLIIMDEPTSSLTQTETDLLYEVIDSLKAAGVSILYISHRLAEIKRCADRAVVLRDGKNAGSLVKAEISHDNLVKLMVGRDLKQLFPKTRPDAAGAAVLKINGLRYQNGPKSLASFEVRAGEVLGMAGLVGAGRTELSEAIFGIRTIAEGTIELNGERLKIQSPSDALEAGILLVPEDRRLNGLVLEAGVGFNLSLPNLDRVSSMRFVSGSRERSLIEGSIAQLRVKTPTAAQPVGLLSGGNQQKVVFGKWLARGPNVLILDEPTRGVDVGAKTEIYALIDELAGRGVAIWMITSDMEELLGVSDRVLVMHEGRIAGELKKEDMNEEAVMHLATGSE